MTVLTRRQVAMAMPDRRGVGEVLLDASSLSVQRQGRAILSNIDLAVCAGEFVALVGPNGAGKSTLLGVLSGDVQPDSGIVEIFGRPVAQWDPISLAQRRAVLPQHCEVTFPFRVDEVVAMGRSPWMRTPAGIHDEAIVDAAMAAVEIMELRARTMSALSGGEAARVALARVLAQDAQLLLLDEPTAALDIRHVARSMEQVRAHVDKGGAAIVVLHDLDLAASYADRVVIVAQGSVRVDAPPAEALGAELLTEVYRHPIRVLHDHESGTSIVRPVHATQISDC